MLNSSASLAISTSVLKALLGKLDIKRYSPSILYILGTLGSGKCESKGLFNSLLRRGGGE